MINKLQLILIVPTNALIWFFVTTASFDPQIREQMSGPDLHVFTLGLAISEDEK